MYLAKGVLMVTIADGDVVEQEGYIKELLVDGWQEIAYPKPLDGKEHSAKPGEDGNLIWVADNKAECRAEREWRDGELLDYVDHYQKILVWNSLTGEQQEAVANYRSELLEYPQHEGFPNCPRPTQPNNPQR